MDHRSAVPSPRRGASLARWWFGGSLLVAAAFVLTLYVQLVHAAVERGAMARAALPLPPTGAALAQTAPIDRFDTPTRRPARATRAATTTTVAPLAGRTVAAATL